MSATKHDDDKPPLDLLPSAAIFEVGRALKFGARKHGAEDWRDNHRVMGEHIGAALRHILLWKDDTHYDHESGLSHLAHATCRLLFALDHEMQGSGIDDSWAEVRKGRFVKFDPTAELHEDGETTTDSFPITI